MTRQVNKDDLLAACSGADVEAVRRVLDAFLSGDAEEPIKTYIENFVRKSIKEIVGNLGAGKPPNADLAFLLKRANRKPNSTFLRNTEIAREVQALRDAGEKRVYAVEVVSDKYCLSTESIETIYKNGKARAVRDLKLVEIAGVREANIQVETFLRDKLSGDELLLETILRHERSLIGRQ